MSTWAWVAVVAGLILIIVIYIVSRPRLPPLTKKASLPTPETVTRTLEEIDWTGLRRRLEQLADAALPERSKKVKELLQATPPGRDSYIQTIDRIANMSILFVDPARLTALAGRMRRTLDQETG
ncbi:MAG TPA: hypothetical protein VGD57_05995 [Candidatus Dormibacteraeota bacterium]|jgi:hypothetical protein